MRTGKLVTGTTSNLEGSINDVFEFVKKHKKIIALGELALYTSSFGPAVLKDLAGSNVEVEIYGEKVPLKNLVDNPELIKTIDRRHNYVTPIDILTAYSPPESFKHDITTFSLKHHVKIIDENNVDRSIYFSDIGGDSENLKN
ncbi:MAG: hypothetical protein U9P70_04520 [Patescibacteria group bacterium]|nr:hypothetical protein [Patescibacteria group bacterium]